MEQSVRICFACESYNKQDSIATAKIALATRIYCSTHGMAIHLYWQLDCALAS
jgi:hypothetical protein